MIQFENDVFYLETENSSYWFRISPYGHLETVHYGKKMERGDIQGLLVKRTAQTGSSVCYDEKTPSMCLIISPCNGRETAEGITVILLAK